MNPRGPALAAVLFVALLGAGSLLALPAGAQDGPDEIHPDWFKVKWEVQREDSVATLWGCDWSADGTMIACVYFDRHVNIYNPEDGTLLEEFDVPEAGGGTRCDGQLTDASQYPLRYAEFSPDSSLLAVCGDDRAATVYSTETWEEVWQTPLQEAACLSVAWSPNATWLVTGSGREKVNGTGAKVNVARVWDIDTMELVKTFDDPLFGPIVSSRFSPSGKYLTLNSDNSNMYIYDTSDLSLDRVLEGHTSGVLDSDWSRDEKWIVSGSRDYTARVWDLVNGTYVKYDHDNCVRGARWDASDHYFLTSGIEKTARLYDPAQPDPLVTFTEGIDHESNIMASRWSPDGQSFVSALGKERYLVLYYQEEPPPPPFYEPLLNKTMWGCCILTVVSFVAVVMIFVRPILNKTRGRRG